MEIIKTKKTCWRYRSKGILRRQTKTFYWAQLYRSSTILANDGCHELKLAEHKTVIGIIHTIVTSAENKMPVKTELAIGCTSFTCQSESPVDLSLYLFIFRHSRPLADCSSFTCYSKISNAFSSAHIQPQTITDDSISTFRFKQSSTIALFCHINKMGKTGLCVQIVCPCADFCRLVFSTVVKSGGKFFSCVISMKYNLLYLFFLMIVQNTRWIHSLTSAGLPYNCDRWCRFETADHILFFCPNLLRQSHKGTLAFRSFYLYYLLTKLKLVISLRTFWYNLFSNITTWYKLRLLDVVSITRKSHFFFVFVQWWGNLRTFNTSQVIPFINNDECDG